MSADRGNISKRFTTIQSAQTKYVNSNKAAVEALIRAIDRAEVNWISHKQGDLLLYAIGWRKFGNPAATIERS